MKEASVVTRRYFSCIVSSTLCTSLL